MKYIKRFEECFSPNNVTVKYCLGQLSREQFFSYIDEKLLNENLLSDIKIWANEKVMSVMKSFVSSAIRLGYSVLSKFIDFLIWCSSKINNLKNSNPILCKTIIITGVIFICLIVCASEAKAQSIGGVPPDPNVINAAIGYLKSIQFDGQIDSMVIQKAMAYLVDIRDGQQSISSQVFTKQAIEIAEAGVTAVKQMKSESSDDSSFILAAAEYIKAGSEYLAAEMSKVGGRESVKLVVK